MTDRLKICMLTTFYPPYSFGGDAIGIQRLAEALARRGHDITVVHDADAYFSKGGKPVADPPDNAVRTVALKSPAGLLANFLTHQTGRPVVHGAQIRALLETGGFDIIWHHNASLIGGPGILGYGDALKVYEAHEHWLVCPTHVLWRFNRERCESRQCLLCTLSYSRPPQIWRYNGALDRALENIDLFLAKSEFSRAQHRQFGFKPDMSVVPYFLPDAAPDAAPGDGAADGPAHERPYFLFVGRLEKIKGVQDVIPAFRSYPQADFLVIGAGAYEDELKAQAADLPNVKFLGFKSQADLQRYYRDAKALIVPSVCFETFGIILIEAFRNATPVIARRLGPFPEIVERGGGGLLFDDEASLVAAMSSIESDPDHRDRLSAEARASFETHWCEEVVLARYLDALADAAHRTGRSALAARLEAARSETMDSPS